MKPSAETAMRSLIKTVKVSMPLEMTQAELCSGVCRGCSKKLIDFVSMELEGLGEPPGAG